MNQPVTEERKRELLSRIKPDTGGTLWVYNAAESKTHQLIMDDKKFPTGWLPPPGKQGWWRF